MICSENNTLTALRLAQNQIGNTGAASIGGALAYVTVHLVNELSTFLWRHPIFSDDNGIIKVYLCLICSQNNTLKELGLGGNQIGDAGAISIAGALAYVTFSLVNELSFVKTFLWRHPIFLD